MAKHTNIRLPKGLSAHPAYRDMADRRAISRWVRETIGAAFRVALRSISELRTAGWTREMLLRACGDLRGEPLRWEVVKAVHKYGPGTDHPNQIEHLAMVAADYWRGGPTVMWLDERGEG